MYLESYAVTRSKIGLTEKSANKANSNAHKLRKPSEVYLILHSPGASRSFRTPKNRGILSEPMFPLFLQFSEKDVIPKWIIYKHKSDKNKKCL